MSALLGGMGKRSSGTPERSLPVVLTVKTRANELAHATRLERGCSVAAKGSMRDE
jgi:hypothetical protein